MGTKKKQRNGHAFHPIMRKGGVHEKSVSAKRSASKRALKNLLSEGSAHSALSTITQALAA